MTKAEATQLKREWDAKYKSGQRLKYVGHRSRIFTQKGRAIVKNVEMSGWAWWKVFVRSDDCQGYPVHYDVTLCKPIAEGNEVKR